MPTLPEFSARLNVPLEEVVRMGELQVRNTDSAIFRSIMTKVGNKLAAQKATSEKEGMKNKKTRVYIQHAVPSTDRYGLIQAFPQFDIRFSGVDMRAAAVAYAIHILIVEYMFHLFRVKKGVVLVYGASIKQLVMRGKDYAHLCVPGHVSHVQAEFLKDDRAISAMINSGKKTGKEPSLASKYVNNLKSIHCASPNTCEVEAPAAVMLLHKTDTNFRQVAFYMQKKKTRLLYFAIPGNKHMELCTEGPFPELDAYVMPSDDGRHISIAYKNAQSLDMTYTFANYLELVARTSVVLAGTTYHKEFHSRMCGMLVFKVTAIQTVFEEPSVSYKSWTEPEYRSKYMVYAPVLSPHGNVGNVGDWSMVATTVDRAIVDDVMDYAMRTQGSKDLGAEIRRRLFTRTSNYVLAGQVMSGANSVPINQFDLLALSIYCTVFMRKYRDGITVGTLAPHARELARLAKVTPSGLVSMYAGTIFGNMLRHVGGITDKLRHLYNDAVVGDGIPMPTFSVCPGFVEYTDSASSNPRFMGWTMNSLNPVEGFTNMLPGVLPTYIPSKEGSAISVVSVSDDDVAQLCITGEGFIDGGVLKPAEHASVVQLACGVFSAFGALITEAPDVESFVESNVVAGTAMYVPSHIDNLAVQKDLLVVEKAQKARPVTHTDAVYQLVDRIVDGQDGLVSLQDHQYVESQVAFSPGVPEVIQGAYADNARLYLEAGVRILFPNSLVMTTQSFESDRQYSSWDEVCKAIRWRMDVSKLGDLKPESFYLPLVRGHVQPGIKNTFNTTLHTIAKRNANTPADAEMLDIEFLWDRAWSACMRVFYNAGASEVLAAMPGIGPSVEDVHEWVSRLDERKRQRLVNQEEGYSMLELIDGATRNQLMLKTKLKPSLDASYETSVKYPQSIQFDPSGKTVAVYTPIISQVVSREQEVLKPNVLVLQRKSIEDVNVFLNGFDWRPNAKGVRQYIEVDYVQFDKSQPKTLAEFYLRRLGKFGVLPIFIDFIRSFQTARTVSAMKAGNSIDLRYQNQSGASFTLDRNNVSNMLAIAELLEMIADAIEFVILMGDDINIAIRGDVDISQWEYEINRKFNLSLKVEVHAHGYICSMDIVHFPDGHSRVVADVIKRALSFMDQSVLVEETFAERFVSYADSLRGIEDTRVQQYLAAAIPTRLRSVLPTVTSEAILSLCKAHARFKTDYLQFRGMYAAEKTTRFY